MADWTCVRGSAYLSPAGDSDNSLTNSQASTYNSQGFEVGIHVDSNPTCSNRSTADLDSFYTNLLILCSTIPQSSCTQYRSHALHRLERL